MKKYLDILLMACFFLLQVSELLDILCFWDTTSATSVKVGK